MPDPLFHVVLHEPEIPNNAGNIGRTCVATGCVLHLIHPLGFETDEKACRRAGLDYWPRLGVREHTDWDEYIRAERPGRTWLFSTSGAVRWDEAEYQPGDHLVFGKETAGLPRALLEGERARTVYLPMVAGERSLNLATVVCTVIYEGVRQLVGSGLVALDGSGRLIV